MFEKKEFDERQIAIRGRITTQTVILSIGLLLLVSFINDFKIIDIEKNIGLSSTMIVLMNIILTFLSCSLILRDAYIGLICDSRGKLIFIVFSSLFLIQGVLMISDMINHDVSLLSVVTLIMTGSISTCMGIKRKSWSN